MRVALKTLLACVGVIGLSACHHHATRGEDYSSILAQRARSVAVTYRVKPGDTLYGIAFRYGLDHRVVARWNGIASPYTIYPGQKLHLSAPAIQKHQRSSKASTAKTSRPKTSTGKARGATATGKTSASRTKTTPLSGHHAVVRTAPSSQSPASSSGDPKAWLWPSNGRIIRTYVAANPARNGLDIAGRDGQSVIATAAGKVVYSGSGLIGFGELIIVKHSERMLSAYAHNRVRLVHEGEWVKAGQKIAEMGRNDEDEQLLHFEIRVLGKPVNPLLYLPKR